MHLIDIIMGRRSVRKYRAEKIPKEILKRILTAGRYAPSAANKQPWHFIVITDQEIKEKLSTERWTNSFIKDSAFTIVGCAYQGNVFSRIWSTIDTTIALQNMVIAAWSLGIGSCWVGDFDEAEVRRMLRVPHRWKIISLISFGYPDETPKITPRRSLKKIISHDRF
jgi:nitroreductase